MVTVCTGFVHDDKSFEYVSIIEEMTNIVVNGKYYRFINWPVGQFKRERVLKTTDVSKIIETKDLEVENYDTKLIIVEFEGKFTLVELPNLEVQCKCPKRNNMVSVQDEIVICGNCSTVTICDQYSSNSNIKSIIMDTKTKHKYPIKHVLLKEIICTPITKKKNRNNKKPASHKLCLYCQHTWWGIHQYCYYIQHFHGIMSFILSCWNPFSNITHFQPVFSFTHVRSVLRSGPIKIKYVQIILENFASANVYKSAVNEISLTLGKHLCLHLTR